jgi:dihydroflavonol-4-reductase
MTGKLFSCLQENDMQPTSFPSPAAPVGHELPLPNAACKLWQGWQGCRVLVTGATGFTGARLVERLCALGAQVVAVHRRDNIPDRLAGKAIEWLRGEIFDPDVVRAACREVQIVFHLAASYRQAGLADALHRRVHVESTELLAMEMLAQGTLHRFVHVSTVGVHGHVEGLPADESAPFSPGDIYQQTKAEAELWIRAFAAVQGLPLTVMRPAAIYGPGDRRLLKLFRLAKLPLVPLIGPGRGFYHLIHVDDLVESLLLAAVDPRAVGEIFICGNAEPIRLKEVIREIAGHLGRQPRFIHLPEEPVFLAARLCEGVSKKLGLEPLLYPRRVAFFTKERSFNTDKLHSWLEFREQYSNRDGLLQTCDWYRQNGWL